MTFNKTKEERKWKLWKEREEKMMRKAGMNEYAIKALRQMDWQDFNEERRYREHLTSDHRNLVYKEEQDHSPVAMNIQQLIDSVENEQLLHILQDTDKKTLQILLLKMWGFSIKEISTLMGIPEKTIYTRMDRLRKKVKKIMKE